MPFADKLFRQGHLSEQALTQAILANERPAHLDRCTLCTERAAGIGRWLDRMRAEAVDAADAAFPAERLAVQHAQILRRIAQAEEPVRVLEFPTHHGPIAAPLTTRRVAPAWLAVAAAAGLVVGVVGGHMSARVDQTAQAQAGQVDPAIDSSDEPLSPGAGAPMPGLFDLDVDRPAPVTLRGMDENTPNLIPAQYALSR